MSNTTGKTIQSFGRLDAAFNNAGIEQAPKATAEITEEMWDRILGIDLRGVLLCMKCEIPLMLKQGAPQMGRRGNSRARACGR